MFNNLFNWLLGAGREAAVFFISMTPLLELRGAVPLGTAAGMSWMETLLLAIAGNLVPIPFIVLFTEKFLDWLNKLPAFAHMAGWYRSKLANKSDKITKYARIGLFLFVAVPLPGTGAWSGAAIASLLKMPVGKAFISIAGGVVAAGIIMTLLSQGTVMFAGLF